MSRFISGVDEAYRRWITMNDATVRPVVKVTLTTGRSHYFNGLAIAPNSDPSSATVALSNPGMNATTLVVRDDDLFSVEIEAIS